MNTSTVNQANQFIPEGLPNITGKVGPLDDGSSTELGGSLYRVRDYSYDASSSGGGNG